MQTFCKSERLTKKKDIDVLFEKGNRFNLKNCNIIWRYSNIKTNYPSQVLICIPKKRVHNSTKRNQIKRYLKEAYRKRKSLLYHNLLKQKRQIQFAIIYQNNNAKYKVVESEIKLILDRLINKF